MTTDEQALALLAAANPVPSLDLLDPVDIDHLIEPSKRSSVMNELRTIEPERDEQPRRRPLGRQRPGLLVAAIAVVLVAMGIGMFVASRGPSIPATPVDRALVFWVAMANGDRETALAQMAPGAADLGGANTFGRAHTLAGQFDWYEAVGFRWAVDDCVATAQGHVECAVTGRNDWSDALGLDPIPGIYVMEIGEDGITEILEKDESFSSQWAPLAFEVFATWVETNHPADPPLMWNESDINEEILDLFEINTNRFVEAHTGG